MHIEGIEYVKKSRKNRLLPDMKVSGQLFPWSFLSQNMIIGAVAQDLTKYELVGRQISLAGNGAAQDQRRQELHAAVGGIVNVGGASLGTAASSGHYSPSPLAPAAPLQT